MQLIFLGDLLQLGVLRLQGLLFFAQLVIVLRLDQHARIRTEYAGKGQHANQGSGHKNI